MKHQDITGGEDDPADKIEVILATGMELEATVVGLVVAYGTVRWLSGRPATRARPCDGPCGC